MRKRKTLVAVRGRRHEILKEGKTIKKSKIKKREKEEETRQRKRKKRKS